MKITAADYERILGRKLDFAFGCDVLAFSNSSIPNTLSFIDDERFLGEIKANQNITVVISNFGLAPQVKDKLVIPAEDARFDFFTLMNEIGKRDYVKKRSTIDPTAIIHPSAFVAEFNVVIGERTVVEPNVSILSDVEIGKDCIIRAGAVIGAEGFEFKRTSKSILPVFHDGKVIIGDKVNIGALTSIAKGFSFRHTKIGDETKTDNLVHIAHGAEVGKRCLLAASCMLAGSVTIADDVWIGPNATISSGVKVGAKAFITLGSVVVRNVIGGQQVSGNFAIPHEKFLRSVMDAMKK